jgi:hypothetical protein
VPIRRQPLANRNPLLNRHGRSSIVSSAIDELEAENSASRDNIGHRALADNAKELGEEESTKSNGDLDTRSIKRFLSMRKQRAEPKY